MVGGYAVGYHGYPRATGDMDIWIAVTPDNARKVSEVFCDFGMSASDISESLFLEKDKVIQWGIHRFGFYPTGYTVECIEFYTFIIIPIGVTYHSLKKMGKSLILNFKELCDILSSYTILPLYCKKFDYHEALADTCEV